MSSDLKKIKFIDINEGTIVGKGYIGKTENPVLKDVYSE